MIHSVQNEVLSIKVDTLGSELISIKSNEDEFEYLWQKKDDSLSMQAPILFPVIAGLDNDSLYFAGKEYKMRLHGFIRVCTFLLVKEDQESLDYEFLSNEETYKNYPFKFKFNTRYRLNKNRLEITYKVTNCDAQTMFFSVGAHPAFNCPFYENESFEDYYVQMERDENVERRIIQNFMLTGERLPFLQDKNQFQLKNDLFARKAVILEGCKSAGATLRSNKNKKYVKVLFEGFPYIAFWSTVHGGSMLCIEPWYGVPSKRGENLPLDKKEGIISLPPSSEFQCTYSIIAGI